MRPFLLLATRAEDVAADNEYEAFLAFGGLGEAELHRWRLEARPLGALDPGDYSGVILGGGPFNTSDDEGTKSAVQRRVERDLDRLLARVVAVDSPFLGACYGIGALGTHQGAVVDRRHSEPIGAVEITLTPDGRADPLFAHLPDTFEAFVGHKEAISRLPAHAVRLASSAACPVQAFRIGTNAYATQFHPELDVVGLCTRIEEYKHAGYFDPSEADRLKAEAARSAVVHPPVILRRFVSRYRRSATDAARVPDTERAALTAP